MKRFLNMVADTFLPEMLSGLSENTGRSAKDDLSGMRERTSSDWSSQML